MQTHDYIYSELKNYNAKIFTVNVAFYCIIFGVIYNPVNVFFFIS